MGMNYWEKIENANYSVWADGILKKKIVKELKLEDKTRSDIWLTFYAALQKGKLEASKDKETLLAAIIFKILNKRKDFLELKKKTNKILKPNAKKVEHYLKKLRK